MLTLTVKEGGYIKIGDDIYIKYARNVKSNSISITIDAPKELKITRAEVYERELAKKSETDTKALSELEKARARKGKVIK